MALSTCSPKVSFAVCLLCCGKEPGFWYEDIQSVLVGLYEESEKPSNALDYLKENFGSAGSGSSAADSDELQSLKAEIAQLKAQNEALTNKVAELEGQ